MKTTDLIKSGSPALTQEVKTQKASRAEAAAVKKAASTASAKGIGDKISLSPEGSFMQMLHGDYAALPGIQELAVERAAQAGQKPTDQIATAILGRAQRNEEV